MNRHMTIITAFSVHAMAVICPLSDGAPAQAQSVEEFYRGKSISLILGFGTGGLNDIAGRLVGQHLGRFIPGQPRIVAQNMLGAGGLVAANHLYNVAARDGTVIAALDRNTAQTGIRGIANVRFDALRLTWLGSLSDYGTDAYPLFVDARHPAKTVDDINRQRAPTRLGATGGGSNMLISLLAKEALGLNLKVIRGYTGGPAILLAVERGEVDGVTIGLSALIAEFPQKWERGELRPLLQFGRATRFAPLADVPTAREYAANPEARKLVEFAELPFLISQPFVAPPDLPPARAQALRLAFDQMVRDPAFIAEAKRRRVELSPIDANAMLAVLERAAATPRSIIDRFNAIVDPQN
jgi:tripartite-type tricarboxylate transporter receptor subunit TctC